MLKKVVQVVDMLKNWGKSGMSKGASSLPRLKGIFGAGLKGAKFGGGKGGIIGMIISVAAFMLIEMIMGGNKGTPSGVSSSNMVSSLFNMSNPLLPNPYAPEMKFLLQMGDKDVETSLNSQKFREGPVKLNDLLRLP